MWLKNLGSIQNVFKSQQLKEDLLLRIPFTSQFQKSK